MQKNNLKNILTTVFTLLIFSIVFIFCFGTTKVGASSTDSADTLLMSVTLDSTEKKFIQDSIRRYDFRNLHPSEGLAEALIFHEIDHPEIVYAQAVLETGYFKSHGARVKNNLFGLMKRGGLRSFNHWEESVKYYKEHIQNRYNGKGDYYAFLKRINYATDPTYASKLKRIVRETRNVWSDTIHGA